MMAATWSIDKDLFLGMYSSSKDEKETHSDLCFRFVHIEFCI